MSNPYTGGNPFQQGVDNKASSVDGGGGPSWYSPPNASAAAPSYSLPSDTTPGVDTQPQWGNSVGVQPQPTGQWVDPQHGGAPGAAGVPGPPTAHASGPELDTWKCWTSEFYTQFCDVDTNDVLARMGNVLLPFVPPDFLRERHWSYSGGMKSSMMPSGLANAAAAYGGTVEKRADLYGPFWISTTLWVLLAVVGNIMDKLAYNRHVQQYNDNIAKMVNSSVPGQHLYTPEPPTKWVYNFQTASVGATVVYFFMVFMSLLVWGLMKWKNVPVGLTDALCLYGYSMFVWILGAILCAVPATAFQWLVCILAGVWSSGYLLLNMWELWKVTLEKPWFIGLVLLVLGTQFALSIGFKMYFFNYST